MRVPRKISRFVKVNEDVSIDRLKEGDLAKLEDMVLDNPFGKPHVRGGFALENNSTTTNAIETLADVKSQDGTNYILAGHNTFISRSVGAAWTNIKTGLTSGYAYFRHIAFGDDIIVTNGRDKPLRLTGADLATTTDLEIAKPDITSVTVQRANSAVGSMDATSFYLWALVYVTEPGERSNPSNPFTLLTSAIVLPTTTNATELQFLLDNLPVSSDARVTSKWLFRTEGWDLSNADSGKIFYLVGKLDNNTTQYVDGLADTDLDTSETLVFTRVPESAEHIADSNNRVFLGNVVVHQKNFYEPYVVADGYGGNQTVDGVTYADQTDGNLIAKTDTPYGGGAGGNGGLYAARNYQYMYTYVDVNGFESEPSYGEVFKTGGTLGNYRDVTTYYYGVGGIGANDLTNNPEIAFRNIYRTEGLADPPFTANSRPFKLVIQQDIIHKTAPASADYEYFDDLADEAKDSGNGLGATYVEVTKTHKAAISWSQVDRPTYFLLENIRQIFRDDQDAMTGLFDDGNGVLIFKENSIVKLYHTGAPQNWYIRKVWDKFGCDEKKSLVKSGDTIYFRYGKRPYKYKSGQIPQYIGFGKQATLDDMTVINSEVTTDWVIYACTKSTDHHLLIYDKRVETWYQFNFGTYDLTSVLVKKYDDDFWTTNNIYISVAKKIFGYDKTATTDEFSGGSIEISPAIKFPRFQIDGTTLSKLRKMVLDFDRNGSVVVNLTLTTDAGTDSPVAINSGEGLLRITGFNKPESAYFDIELDGGIIQIDDFRADLRPIRRGIAV